SGHESRRVGGIVIILVGACGNPQGRKEQQCGYACIMQKNAGEGILDTSHSRNVTYGAFVPKVVMHFMQIMHGAAPMYAGLCIRPL
ncbi:MAG TPA: hypothetical protein VKH44_08170, partial [Pirellulaceae bacterium]|nr:hypothetical protein [Pirellulaceae bacterium]